MKPEEPPCALSSSLLLSSCALLFRFASVVAAVQSAANNPSPPPSCLSNRPNSWADHRTLYIPTWMWNVDAADLDASRTAETTNTLLTTNEAWAEALCCVYTHVELVEQDEPDDDDDVRVTFETYDGSRYKLRGTTFEEIAARAMDDICGMSMGSQDCSRRDECIQQAFATVPPSPSPTTKAPTTNKPTTVAPTKNPTSRPTPTLAPTLSEPNKPEKKLLLDLFNCTSDRPDSSWASHRTLWIPEDYLLVHNNTTSDTTTNLSSNNNETSAISNNTITITTTTKDDDDDNRIAWMEALCCVYTHVQISTTNNGGDDEIWLELYDGSSYGLPPPLDTTNQDANISFNAIADIALQEICGMSLGSQDCQQNQICIDNAMMNQAEGHDNLVINTTKRRRKEEDVEDAVVVQSAITSSSSSSSATRTGGGWLLIRNSDCTGNLIVAGTALMMAMIMVM